MPVRVKKTRQNKELEPPFRFNRNGKGSSEAKSTDRLICERFRGTHQETSSDSLFRCGRTSSVLPVASQPQSPLPSRFVRSSRSSRWRYRPLTLQTAKGF